MEKTHVVMLLDESGSMTPHQQSVVESFNNYIKELKNGTKRCFISLFKFDKRLNESRVLRKVFENRKVKKCHPLTTDQYRPYGGTPLLDAVADLIKATKKRLPKEAKVLFVVHTDGQENASSFHNQETVRELIAKCEKKRGWTFVYLGEGAAAWDGGYSFGIDNVANFSSSLRGESMSKLADATAVHAMSSTRMTKSFYGNAGLAADDIDEADPRKVSSATQADTADANSD